MFARLAIVLICFSFFTSNLRSQAIADLFSGYIDENAKPYLAPLSHLIAGNLHSGIREWGNVDSSFHVKLGINLIFAYPTSNMKSFMGKTIAGFEPEQVVEVPTVIGANDAVRVEGVNGTAFIFPVGYKLEKLPLVVPQITFGGVFNTEITLRYFALNTDDEIDKIDFLGFGIRHGLNDYIGDFPYDIGVSYMFQRFNVSPFIFGKYQLIAGHIGKSGKKWTSMITLGYQNAQTDFVYSRQDGTDLRKYEVNIKGNYPLFVELMGGVKLWIFHLRGSVSYAGPLTASVGLHVKI